MLRRGIPFLLFLAIIFGVQSFFHNASNNSQKLIKQGWGETEQVNFGNLDLSPTQVQYITESQLRPNRRHRGLRHRVAKTRNARKSVNNNRPSRMKNRLRKLAKKRLLNKKRGKVKTLNKPLAPKGKKVARKIKNKKLNKKKNAAKKVAKTKTSKKDKLKTRKSDDRKKDNTQSQRQQFIAAPFFTAPAEDPAPTGSPAEEEKIDHYAIWSEKLLKNADTETTGEFVRAYLAGDFSKATFFKLTNEMIAKDDEFQAQALLALSAVPDINSFKALTAFTNRPDVSASLLDIAQKEISAYANLSRVSIINQAMQDESDLVASTGLSTLNQLVSDLKNAPTRTIAESERSLRLLDVNDPTLLGEVIPVLDSLCDDRFDNSCNALDEVKSFLPGE